MKLVLLTYYGFTLKILLGYANELYFQRNVNDLEEFSYYTGGKQNTRCSFCNKLIIMSLLELQILY